MSCARTLLGSPQVPLANVTLISELRRYAHLNPVCVSRYGLEKPEQMLGSVAEFVGKGFNMAA